MKIVNFCLVMTLLHCGMPSYAQDVILVKGIYERYLEMEHPDGSSVDGAASNAARLAPLSTR